MSFRTRFTGLTAVLSAAVMFFGSSISPAAASTSGLYGTQDPTYDGVFRQSLAIVALTSLGQPIPDRASAWLTRQQCSDGAFEAFRANLANPCKPGDLNNYNGRDTNSTALGAIALVSLNKPVRAKKAVAWIATTQNADGGFPWIKGGESDAASTALAMMAIRAIGAAPVTYKRNGKSPLAYLRSAVLGCAAPAAKRGALAFQVAPTLFASDMTTAQALFALSATLPITPQPTSSRITRTSCPAGTPADLKGLKDVIAGYTADRLQSQKFAIPSAFGSGIDWSSTAWSVLGLLGSQRGFTQAKAATANLKRNVAQAIRGGDNQIEAGKVALMLLVARARGEAGTNFGGVNLVRTLQGQLK